MLDGNLQTLPLVELARSRCVRACFYVLRCSSSHSPCSIDLALGPSPALDVLGARFFSVRLCPSCDSLVSLEMSAPVDEAWPKEGTVYKTKEDVLLVCQLAALEAGFSLLGGRVDAKNDDQWRICCRVSARQKILCQRTVAVAQAVDRSQEELGWRITLVRAENLEASRHPLHPGVSKPLQVGLRSLAKLSGC